MAQIVSVKWAFKQLGSTVSAMVSWSMAHVTLATTKTTHFGSMESVGANKAITLSTGNVSSLDQTTLLQLVWPELFFLTLLVSHAPTGASVALLRVFVFNADQNSPTTLPPSHVNKIVEMDFVFHSPVMTTTTSMETAVVSIAVSNPNTLVLEDLLTSKIPAQRHYPTKSQSI